jgi:hypothetical protein
MRHVTADAALRRGIYDGLIIAAVIAVGVVLTNVVFPSSPQESDSDPEYVIQLFATYAIMGLLLVAIGAHARSRSDTPLAGLKGGAGAGFVVAVLIVVIFIVVNNVFLDIVSQQHDKRVAFAASGWSSLRAYLTVSQLRGALFLVPAATLTGALLGFVGGALFRLRYRDVGLVPVSRPSRQGRKL